MKRILVTGANKGIGFALVEQILRSRPDTFVYLGSRSPERGEQAVRELISREPSWETRLNKVVLDVADDSSVHAAAATLSSDLGTDRESLFGIVNNAGIGLPVSELMSTLQVNVYGIQRVCEAFSPLLTQESGRIVNITSAAGPSYVATCHPDKQIRLVNAQVSWKDVQDFMAECLAVRGGEEAFGALGLGSGSSYGISKACANALTLHWARENPGLLVNACTPGFIETDLTRPFAESRGVTPASMGMKSPREGTVAPMFLLFGQPHGSGHYYGSDAQRSPLDRYRSPGDPPYTGE